VVKTAGCVVADAGELTLSGEALLRTGTGRFEGVTAGGLLQQPAKARVQLKPIKARGVFRNGGPPVLPVYPNVRQRRQVQRCSVVAAIRNDVQAEQAASRPASVAVTTA
jgi:hypothetical protein